MTRAIRFGFWLAVLSGAPTLAFAQRLGGGASALDLPLLRLGAGLVLCTLVAAIAALMLRRSMRRGGPGRGQRGLALFRAEARKVRVVESRPLSAHADVCVLTCDGREYLVVVSSGAATVLCEKPETADASP